MIEFYDYVLTEEESRLWAVPEEDVLDLSEAEYEIRQAAKAKLNINALNVEARARYFRLDPRPDEVFYLNASMTAESKTHLLELYSSSGADRRRPPIEVPDDHPVWEYFAVCDQIQTQREFVRFHERKAKRLIVRDSERSAKRKRMTVRAPTPSGPKSQRKEAEDQ